MAENAPKPNYWRRLLGVAVFLLPFGILAASLTYGLQRGPISPWRWWLGLTFMTMAAGLAALNFYLAFVRPLLYRQRHGSMESYHYISGFPGIGTILTLVGAIVGFGAVLPAALGIAATLFDTGSVSWFVLGTWKDESFWDA